MASFREINAKLEKLSRAIDDDEMSSYSCSRDEDANLIVNFKNGDSIKLPIFEFRNYQKELAKTKFIKGIKRFALMRPRRSGKEAESWNILLQDAIENTGLYLMVYPTNVRARFVLWEGSILLEDGKILKFLDMLPKRFVSGMPKNDTMTIKLKNGALIWVLGSDIDPDKLRGTNPRGIVFSEFAFQDPRVFYTMLPALRQNNGWALIQSTFDGQNHFWKLMQENKDNPDWYCRVDSITNLLDSDGNRYITDEMVEEDRKAGMPEYLIQQEYYGVVEINQQTRYFSDAIKYIYDNGHIISGLYSHDRRTYAAWDIGINDSNAIILFQLVPISEKMEIHIVGYIEGQNKFQKDYVMEVNSFCARYRLNLYCHFVPHDGKKRNATDGENFVTMGNKLGEKFIVVDRPTDKRLAIEISRRNLYSTKFHKEETSRLLTCLSEFKKKFDEKTQEYIHVHDWASHGVDAYQTAIIAIQSGLVASGTRSITYYSEAV